MEWVDGTPAREEAPKTVRERTVRKGAGCEQWESGHESQGNINVKQLIVHRTSNIYEERGGASMYQSAC